MFLPFALCSPVCLDPGAHMAGGAGAGGRLPTIAASHAGPTAPIGLPLGIGMQHAHGYRSCWDLSLAAHERTWGTSGTMSHTGMQTGFLLPVMPREACPSLLVSPPSPAPHPLHSPRHSFPSLPVSRGSEPRALQLSKSLGTNTIPARPDPHTSLDLTGNGHDTVSQWRCHPQRGDREPESQLHQELGPASEEMQEWTNGPQGGISILNQQLSESPASLGPHSSQGEVGTSRLLLPLPAVQPASFPQPCAQQQQLLINQLKRVLGPEIRILDGPKGIQWTGWKQYNRSLKSCDDPWLLPAWGGLPEPALTASTALPRGALGWMLTAGRGSVATLLLTRPGRGTVAPRTMQEAKLKPHIPANLSQHRVDTVPKESSCQKQRSSLGQAPCERCARGLMGCSEVG